ncbi:type II toxin-antitoxin system RelE/ParE family toxin [Anabaena minutissima FACHB-250]|nr:type II toxin-antitoxin system RelE/ParE family toxin [Anabaena minutissima FACHB-250]
MTHVTLGVTISVTIKTFKHKGIKKLFEDDNRSGVQPAHAEKLLDILDTLDAATEIKDMQYPGSGLHQLKGDRKGEWSVTVTKNWRITFTFEEGDAYDVNYEDYH